MKFYRGTRCLISLLPEIQKKRCQMFRTEGSTVLAAKLMYVAPFAVLQFLDANVVFCCLDDMQVFLDSTNLHSETSVVHVSTTSKPGLFRMRITEKLQIRIPQETFGNGNVEIAWKSMPENFFVTGATEPHRHRLRGIPVLLYNFLSPCDEQFVASRESLFRNEFL